MAETLEDSYMSGSSMTGEGNESNPANAFLKNCWFLYGNTALRQVGGLDTVNGIYIYTDSFDAKEEVLGHLDAWNDSHETEKQVKYTDKVGMMMTMVETMLDAITYVLVAFTAISLVVSSVMIGIITYVSVVERVKEIGVLRSLGARKKDIKNLFNAETFIIGLASGVFGVIVTYVLSIAINSILAMLTGIATLASLPISSALIMVAISIILTLISGLIPANAAAKKDPVVALRTE
jgi:putative ABC transport system permease protein